MILITGGAGFVGHTLATRIVGEGQQTRCLVRDIAKAKSILPTGTEIVGGDIQHPETLNSAFEGIDIVVHSAFMTAERKQQGEDRYQAINVDGTQNVIAAAKRNGVKRVIIVSGLGTVPDKPGTYMQGRYLAEEAVKQSGLNWSILQPSIQFGKDAAFFKGLANLIREVPFVVPVAGSGKEIFQPIWVEDVVTCLTMLVKEPERDGQSYPVGGPDILTYGQILDMLMDTLKIHKLKVPGPRPAVAVAASAIEAILPKPPITRAALELFKFPNAVTPDIVERTFGFKPKSLKAWMAENGAY
jgi:uncharacterized protein YbjT (DUF2867 family)